MNNSKIKLCLTFVFVTISTMVMPAVELSSYSWGPAEKQLSIGIVLTVTNVTVKSPSEILICFKNVSKEDVVLNLGITLANGKVHHPTGLELVLTEYDGGTNRFQYIPLGGIAGRVDPFVVPLPAGATFQICCPLKSFIQNNSNRWPGLMRPGQYRLAATFTGKVVNKEDANIDMVGLSLIQYWTGKAHSGEISISIP
jgi:hypothetical protein